MYACSRNKVGSGDEISPTRISGISDENVANQNRGTESAASVAIMRPKKADSVGLFSRFLDARICTDLSIGHPYGKIRKHDD